MEAALGFVCFSMFVIAAVGFAIFGIVGHQLNKKAKALQATYITREKFERVRVGMSFTEVVAMIGKPEQELSSVGDATGDVTTFRWRGGAIAHAILVFQTGKLISKTQVGL